MVIIVYLLSSLFHYLAENCVFSIQPSVHLPTDLRIISHLSQKCLYQYNICEEVKKGKDCKEKSMREWQESKLSRKESI
jgi:hypothetical protein